MGETEKEFEVAGVRYLLSGNMILWRWNGRHWEIASIPLKPRLLFDVVTS